jgi:hypothetical protein
MSAPGEEEFTAEDTEFYAKAAKFRYLKFLRVKFSALRRGLTNTIQYRIIYRMKVTAIIDDILINSVKEFTHSSTVTEAITIALNDWIDIYNIKELNKQIANNPIIIKNGNKIRKINRKI